VAKSVAKTADHFAFQKICPAVNIMSYKEDMLIAIFEQSPKKAMYDMAFKIYKGAEYCSNFCSKCSYKMFTHINRIFVDSALLFFKSSHIMWPLSD
jgi:hypothetical protein